MPALRFKDEKQWSAFLSRNQLTERGGEAGRARVRIPRLKVKLPRSIALWWFAGVALLWNLPLALAGWPWCVVYTLGVFGGLALLKSRLKAGKVSKERDPQGL